MSGKRKDTANAKLSKTRAKLEARLKGRQSVELSALAKKAHDPTKQAELLAHLDHSNVPGEKE